MIKKLITILFSALFSYVASVQAIGYTYDVGSNGGAVTMGSNQRTTTDEI